MHSLLQICPSHFLLLEAARVVSPLHSPSCNSWHASKHEYCIGNSLEGGQLLLTEPSDTCSQPDLSSRDHPVDHRRSVLCSVQSRSFSFHLDFQRENIRTDDKKG